MAKVIVERPRLGDRSRSAASNVTRLHQRPIDEWHRREGMGTRYRRHTRWLNENLAPLRRFLRSRVGRPWDEVYSEICQRINRDSAVQLHVWQHLWDYVCKDAAEVDGRLVSSRDGRPLHGWPWAASFVVHPRTGALCLAPQDEQRFKRNNHRKAPPDYVPVDATHQYRRINGLWFEVELRPFPDGRWDFWDVVFRRQASQLSARDLVVAYGASMYAVGKRQLGKREIRRAGFDRQNGGR
jgi:hypothetical protein